MPDRQCMPPYVRERERIDGNENGDYGDIGICLYNPGSNRSGNTGVAYYAVFDCGYWLLFLCPTNSEQDDENSSVWGSYPQLQESYGIVQKSRGHKSCVSVDDAGDILPDC